MRGTAIVFPGMGPSTFAGIGRFLVLDPYARRRLEETDDVLGGHLLDRLYEPQAGYSEDMQAGFFVASLALADRAVASAGRPRLCVGFSTGQRAAAVFTGAVDFAAGLRLTVALARCERDFFLTGFRDVVTVSFTHCGPDETAVVHAALDERGIWWYPSGRVAPDLHMLTLREADLPVLTELVRAEGGYLLQTMRPPVHAAAFTGLRERAEAEVLGDLPLRDPVISLLSDHDGSLVDSAAALRRMLLDTFDHPVDWPRVVDALVTAGIVDVLITGPDALLHRSPSTKRLRAVPFSPKPVVDALLRPVSAR